jgi:hypothetical protein
VSAELQKKANRGKADLSRYNNPKAIEEIAKKSVKKRRK